MSKRLEPGQFLHSRTLRRLDMEADWDEDMQRPAQAVWDACFINDGMLQRMTNYRYGVTPPTPQQIDFAGNLCRLLDRHVTHNGAWLVAWTHPPIMSGLIMVEPDYNWRRFIMLHMDKDGDAQFTIDNVEPSWIVAAANDEHWIEQAEVGWQKWNHLMRDVLNPSESQLTHRARN